MRSPEPRLAMERARPEARRFIKRRRFGSARAANNSAESRGPDTAVALRILVKVSLKQYNHDGPALLVAGEGLGPTSERDLVEARFGNSEQNAFRSFVQGE